MKGFCRPGKYFCLDNVLWYSSIFKMELDFDLVSWVVVAISHGQLIGV